VKYSAVLVAILALAAGCGAEEGSDPSEQRFPDVIAVDAEQAADATWTFRVTMSSAYDTPQRYADGWRVSGLDGTVYGVHQLAHDHATEQPFTRTQRGVEIPDDVIEVIIEGRDLEHGFGGATTTVTLGPDQP
jgi:hypothetical protein